MSTSPPEPLWRVALFRVLIGVCCLGIVTTMVLVNLWTEPGHDGELTAFGIHARAAGRHAISMSPWSVVRWFVVLPLATVAITAVRRRRSTRLDARRPTS